MELRPYQWEVIMPALEGKNIIIWLPTGAGKTRAAAYVAKRHLETVDRAKVVVLVNRVHLVTQHCEEFSRMLDGCWTIATLSGDMGPLPESARFNSTSGVSMFTKASSVLSTCCSGLPIYMMLSVK